MNHRELREVFIWTTREGVEWILKDMKDSHVRNCIGHVTRNYDRINMIDGSRADRYITIFKAELRYRRSSKIKKLLCFSN